MINKHELHAWELLYVYFTEVSEASHTQPLAFSPKKFPREISWQKYAPTPCSIHEAIYLWLACLGKLFGVQNMKDS